MKVWIKIKKEKNLRVLGHSLFLKIFHENQEGFLQSHNLIILLYVMLLKINMS